MAAHPDRRYLLSRRYPPKRNSLGATATSGLDTERARTALEPGYLARDYAPDGLPEPAYGQLVAGWAGLRRDETRPEPGSRMRLRQPHVGRGGLG